MLSRPAALISPNIYRRLAQQQFSGLLIRLLALVVFGWTMQWELIPLGQWHIAALTKWLMNSFTLVCLAYSLASAALFICQMIWVNKREVFVASSICDTILVVCLLALFPGVALVGFSVAVAAMLAMLQGLNGRFILSQSLILGVCALVVAHFSGVLASSVPMPIHALQALLVLFALLGAWRFEKTGHEQSDIETDLNPISGLPRLKALHTSLHYLLPYHQRNKIPVSLIMIRAEGRVHHVQTMQTFAASVLGRIRRSDVFVQLDDQDLVILLCDTSVSGASVLAKDLVKILESLKALQLTFAVSQISLDHAAIDPLLRRMHDSLEQAKQQKTDRIIFVTEEKQEHISL
ncbi:GGDEF domain-containing protein [Aquirhabdus parva]|uniref:GGDEF domain-containing protein n=1 Tax=Aquirhabdus parva TaxID=2283318 RepID=A0A345P8I2_9GAMM|nr:hypothetical protein [Aquirhabdus parva]AXI03591.1 hypothetical protein HYN46_12580 [Aquirhabdus parva]